MNVTSNAASTTYNVCKRLASGYNAVARDDGEPIEYHWIARCSELPGCMTCGRTSDEALAELEGLIPEFIALLREDGMNVPLPNAHLGKAVWDNEAAYTPKESED